jgi:hypothetical protein
MDSVAEALHLVDEEVERTAWGIEQLARLDGAGVKGVSSPTHRASGMLLAASLRAVVNVDDAIPLFHEAAEELSQLDHPLADVAAACAATRAPRRRARRSDRSDFPTVSPPSNAAAHLLAGAMWETAFSGDPGIGWTATERLVSLNEGPRPLGKLLVPTDLWADVVRAVADTVGTGQRRDLSETVDSPDDRRLDHSLGRFLTRADETVEMAQANRFVWTRMLSTIQPVEPEELAVVAAASLAVRQAFQRDIDLPDASPRAHAMVALGRRIAERADGDWPRPSDRSRGEDG